VDMGASGFTQFSAESLVEMGRAALSSGEVDALIFHGLGMAHMGEGKNFLGKSSVSQMERDVLAGYSGLQAEIGRPVMIGTALSQWESPAVHDLHEAGIRVYHRLDEIACILSLMYGYWRRRNLVHETPA